MVRNISSYDHPCHLGSGFEPDHDAAGYAFPNGEPEPRACTVDQLPRLRPDPLAAFDCSDAAGNTATIFPASADRSEGYFNSLWW